MKSLLENIPDPETRYTLGEVLGRGVFGKVYNAYDTQASNNKVAIKVQKYDKNTKYFVEEEYEVLKELSNVIYLVGFYGIYKKGDEIWFVLENCEGDTAVDLVRGLLIKNRRMSEDHIAFILKEVVKAIIYLHENNVIHRDIKASNILLTREGEVKLCDFGLARKLKDREDKLAECVGSPCWMAPEVVTANDKDSENGFYDNRVDVWGLGITALELAEGKAPFQNMHPSRTLFHIVKNPPPVLEKVSNWSENFHDFISECLVKYYEHRPYIMEVIDHPFLQEIPENNYHLTLEIKSILADMGKSHLRKRTPEVVVIDRYLKTSIDGKLERIVEEDLADLDDISEKNVVELLEARFKREEFYTFVGDILLSVNPNKKLDVFGKETHQKYFGKSRSENSPHIYAVADTAYQNALHHKIPQQIVLTGESASGKTTNYLHIIDHLFYIGEQHPVSVFRIKNGIKLIHALTHASTPTNNYSTRCVLKTNISFGQTGKLTSASFQTLCLEKWRISAVDMNQCNFHILYYIYDGLVHNDATEKYKLDTKRDYRYLRIPSEENREDRSSKPRDNIEQNIIKYKKIFSYLEEFEFSEEQITTFFSVIAAILNLGEIRFKENKEDGSAKIENKTYAENFAELMEIDETKLCWALTNYCVVKRGNVIRKKNTSDEARDARDVLANNLYCRFVNYVVGMINEKLEIGKAIYGEKYSIKVLDFFGFECFKQNHLPQFFVNCLNEQLQYHYIQRIFAWELMDLEAEEMEYEPFNFFDNRKTLNQLLSKPEGVLCIIDEAAKRDLDGSFIMDRLRNQATNRIMISKAMEFSVAHYTGVVSYNAKEMSDKNRDFLPPELIETMRESDNAIIKMFFTNKLDKAGNLMMTTERSKRSKGAITSKVAGVNQFSQIKNMRTVGTIFRGFCLELLKELSVGGSSGGTHFVRCLRSDLKGRPQTFHKELVKQQIRALAVVETARVRQKGYPQRISFPEFLRRYKFLAFDFEENVDITKENCRLLLVRLKMEGWAIGKTKVFLKYYNEEYLARLYETQVKKIIKIQSILRGFLAKCRIAKNVKDQEKGCIEEIKKRRRSSVMTPEEAAGIIQKAYRRSTNKQKSLSDALEPLDQKECVLITPYANRWRSRSMFHVLMQYRAVKMQAFFQFSQQVHLYNQKAFFLTQNVQKNVDLDCINQKADVTSWLGEMKPVALKMRFRLDDIPFYDTSALCDPLTNVGSGFEGDECWDSPYQWRKHQSGISLQDFDMREIKTDHLTTITFNRDPDEPLQALPSSPTDSKAKVNGGNFLVKKSTVAKKESKVNFQKANSYKENEEIFKENKDSFREKQEMFASVQLRKTDNRLRFEQNENTYNSTPANKDFDFIKSSHLTSKPKNADPIAELRNIAKRRESNSEDDPPFNFQGMLRKTNFQRDSIKKGSGTRRDSLKNALVAARRFSLTKEKDNDEDILNGEEAANIINSRPVFMELVPGLILEGIEVDL